MNMKNTVAKARVIRTVSNKTWQESLTIAASANRSNKTQLVIKAVSKYGSLPIEKAMEITGLDKNNLQSRFRTARIATNKVYYDRSSKVFRHVA